MNRTAGCVVAAALLYCMALVAGANAAVVDKGAPLSSSVGGVGVITLNMAVRLPRDSTGGGASQGKRRSLLASPIASFEAATAAATAAAAGGSASSPRKLLEAKALDQRSIVWDVNRCQANSAADELTCTSGYAAACCNDDYCSSNPDGAGGYCASYNDLGCC